ncbi:MAG: DUF488 domain-containing protein [Aliivibrio sp.]|uniref:DUF488 domain-containing protein n=1 Tax=Aliivibrio sp. TaxID=1872443 RepID=UPI001A4EBA05|nr:DUF488 domain-containing protein [Aliivibrio sp.]
MNIYTIGFTQKTAERFFDLINIPNVKTMIDVRINNSSQLSGFAKRDDLRFFLKELRDIEYVHIPELAPTKELLSKYKKKEIKWIEYEEKFLNLMSIRNIERSLTIEDLKNGCLLCSEHEPHFCHRRLVVEYLNSYWDDKLKVNHLL